MMMSVCGGGDPLESLGTDTSIVVITCLKDPADIVRVSSVSRSWRQFVIEYGFSKKLCLKLLPETSIFTGVMEEASLDSSEVGCSKSVEWENLVREHKVYACLARALKSPPIDKGCIQKPISASSTDNYPEESIDRTLLPCLHEGGRPSYWSSGGQLEADIPERLTYYLCSNVCIVHEISVHPFQARFHQGHPIYSSKAVRFKLGYSKIPLDLGDLHEPSPDDKLSKDNYVWTYISPEFPMAQAIHVQNYKLPRPVLCVGGILQIELLGRIQRQEMDDLYYICVCHVQVSGRPLSSFDVNMEPLMDQFTLKYTPKAAKPITTRNAHENEVLRISSWHAIAANIGLMRRGRAWNRMAIRNFLGNLEPVDDDASEEE